MRLEVVLLDLYTCWKPLLSLLPTSEIEALLFFTTGCATPHDCLPDDRVSAAIMMNVIPSSVLFHNCTTPHDCLHVVDLRNCTTPHYGFPIDLGSAATMMIVIASGVFFSQMYYAS
jgi:hypothetical protein